MFVLLQPLLSSANEARGIRGGVGLGFLTNVINCSIAIDPLGSDNFG
jgi:hypothetical protein